MKFPIQYDSQSMTLTFQWGKHYKCLQCPFATWWKARKYFKKPKFKFYFGPMWKYKGKVHTEFGEYDDYEYKGGYWPAASTEFLKRYTPKWFPIHVSSWNIGWKDKYNTPRYEHLGHFIIFFGRDYHKHWQFSMTVTAPNFFCNNDCTVEDHDENYWESMLWYLHYADTYNTLNNKRDIVKARDSMSKYHWSHRKKIKLNDVNIINFGKEELSMGNNERCTFTYFDVMSDKLSEIIHQCNEYPKTKLMSSISVYVDLIQNSDENDNEINKSVFQCSSYTKLYNNDDKEIIRLYYVDHIDEYTEDEKIYKRYVDDDYGVISFEVSEYVDLGPSFKDDYLTRRALDEIKQYHDGIDGQQT